MIPLELYKKATNDTELKGVKQAKTAIAAYGGSRLPVVGQVIIPVWREGQRFKLDCKLVDNIDIRPILGRKACLGMNIIQYMDNDEIHKPKVGNAPVYTMTSASSSGLNRADLIRQFPRVFAEEVGQLEGEYHIKLDATISPVQHAPRRVPVALRDQLKAELDKMTEQGIIAPVIAPTPWVSSLVVVPKKNGMLRLCLDPKDLNKAVQREHYPLPTIEDVATRLHGAKVFTKLDVRSGFWHITLDNASSYLTTFNTPFGRFRWRRMPFGIRSAPEVFQRRMHELIEGMPQVEVIADDFVVVGKGDTIEEANSDHDKNLVAFLRLCDEKGLKLNAEKLKLRQPEVSFIGHIATGKGLKVDPAKVKAIREMPAPTDKAGVQRLLGLAQYLGKFLPHLSDVTKPLRELTQQDVEWSWDEPQKMAFESLKDAVTRTPLLRYFNVKEDVTLQCDASQSGLGAALLQNGQPVAYASRARTPAETRYAQIEKELLAIVFACERFDSYIYGLEGIKVESDHKPLESIFLKPLHAAPQRLQRMLLRLQRYNLVIQYKKGKEIYLADTLSRAPLPDISACEFVHELEEIDHKEFLPVSSEQWQRMKHSAADDPVLQVLRNVIQCGWPESKAEVAPCLIPYYDSRDELTVQGDLVFKGHQLVVPLCLRKEMMDVIHASHIGIEGCIRRARESLYWPRMSAELNAYISTCDVCLTNRDYNPGKEPLMQHELIARPWSKVSADLCEFDGRTLLVISDYYSNFIEVTRMTTTTSRSIIKALKEVFARYGIPDIMVSDNGPQFSSAEFTVFAKTWNFDHKTSSPHHHQSNGKAENAVRTVKRLFRKCKDSGQSEFLALLDWRNTPTEGVGTSPAQRLMGRRCKTLLPIAGTLLQPRHNTEREARALKGMKERQRHHYDKHTKPLKPISLGQTVRMKLPGQRKWSAGTCAGKVDERSYIVKVGDVEYRRNRKQLVSGHEDPLTELADPSEPTPSAVGDPTVTANPQPAGHTRVDAGNNVPPTGSPRRSGRVHKKPMWHKDYSM